VMAAPITAIDDIPYSGWGILNGGVGVIDG